MEEQFYLNVSEARLWRQFLIPALKDKLHASIQIENEKRKSSEVRHLEFQCEQTPFSVITPPPLPHVTRPPTSSQKIGTVLGELLTFLFVKNTLQALAPLADAHIHPHESVLSSLNYSISDYLITLQPKTSMFLTCMEEVRGEDRRGRFSERLTLQLSANKCLFKNMHSPFPPRKQWENRLCKSSRAQFTDE